MKNVYFHTNPKKTLILSKSPTFFATLVNHVLKQNPSKLAKTTAIFHMYVQIPEARSFFVREGQFGQIIVTSPGAFDYVDRRSVNHGSVCQIDRGPCHASRG